MTYPRPTLKRHLSAGLLTDLRARTRHICGPGSTHGDLYNLFSRLSRKQTKSGGSVALCKSESTPDYRIQVLHRGNCWKVQESMTGSEPLNLMTVGATKCDEVARCIVSGFSQHRGFHPACDRINVYPYTSFDDLQNTFDYDPEYTGLTQLNLAKPEELAFTSSRPVPRTASYRGLAAQPQRRYSLWKQLPVITSDRTEMSAQLNLILDDLDLQQREFVYIDAPDLFALGAPGSAFVVAKIGEGQYRYTSPDDELGQPHQISDSREKLAYDLTNFYKSVAAGLPNLELSDWVIVYTSEISDIPDESQQEVADFLVDDPMADVEVPEFDLEGPGEMTGHPTI